MRQFQKIQASVVLIAGLAGLLMFTGCKKSGPMTYEKAVERLAYLVKNVEWSENYVNRRAQVQLGTAQDLAAMLPSINEFSLMNRPNALSGDVVLEIFASMSAVISLLTGINQIIIYLVAIIILLTRPRGLMGRKGVMEE